MKDKSNIKVFTGDRVKIKGLGLKGCLYFEQADEKNIHLVRLRDSGKIDNLVLSSKKCMPKLQVVEFDYKEYELENNTYLMRKFGEDISNCIKRGLFFDEISQGKYIAQMSTGKTTSDWSEIIYILNTGEKFSVKIHNMSKSGKFEMTKDAA